MKLFSLPGSFSKVQEVSVGLITLVTLHNIYSLSSHVLSTINSQSGLELQAALASSKVS